MTTRIPTNPRATTTHFPEGHSMTTGTLKTRSTASPRSDSGARSYQSTRSTRTTRTSRTVERPAQRGERTISQPQALQDRRKRTGRLGSQQQVSMRGRRIAPRDNTDPRARNLAFFMAFALIAGIVSVMWLSGITTDQSFQIADARKQSTNLTNELESLERDVSDAQSAANIAARASEMGMVVPDQTGVLNVNGDKVDEQRPADAAKNRPVIDVNGTKKPSTATSDPAQTANVPGLAPESPTGAAAQNGTGEVPYSNQNSAGGAAAGNQTPAPAAPAPAPEPAPAAPTPAPAPAAPVAPPN